MVPGSQCGDAARVHSSAQEHADRNVAQQADPCCLAQPLEQLVGVVLLGLVLGRVVEEGKVPVLADLEPSVGQVEEQPVSGLELPHRLEDRVRGRNVFEGQVVADRERIDAA